MSLHNEQRMNGIHPDLIKVVHRAAELCKIEIYVSDGLRTIEKQRVLVAQGFSQTMNSRHLTGHAVDLVPMLDTNGDGILELRWDWPGCFKIADAMKKAAKELKVPLEWGGDWRTFKDGPHYQLPWKYYPKGK